MMALRPSLPIDPHCLLALDVPRLAMYLSRRILAIVLRFHLVQTILLLPPLEVHLRTLGSLGKAGVLAAGRLHLASDERAQLLRKQILASFHIESIPLARMQVRIRMRCTALSTQLKRPHSIFLCVCAVFAPSALKMVSYLERVKPRRHHVRPHLLPVDCIASELGVATHGARSRTLIEALVDVLGRQRQLAETPLHLEDLSGFDAAGHLVGCVRGLVVRRVWCYVDTASTVGGRVHRFIFRAWATTKN